MCKIKIKKCLRIKKVYFESQKKKIYKLHSLKLTKNE